MSRKGMIVSGELGPGEAAGGGATDPVVGRWRRGGGGWWCVGWGQEWR